MDAMQLQFCRIPRMGGTLGLFGALALVGACQGDSTDATRDSAEDPGLTGGIDPGQQGSSSTGLPATTFDLDDFGEQGLDETDSDGEFTGTVDPSEGSTEDGDCVDIDQEAMITERPVDIIFVIDNSGSMGDEIDQVRARINEDFVKIIEDSDIDYRVIMFTQYGGGPLEVCINAPLGPTDCTAPDINGPIDNPPRFFHTNINVQSVNSLCLLLDRWDQPDAQGRPPWSNYLRPGSFKAFVEITDDGTACTDFNDRGPNQITGALEGARVFSNALFELSPQHFGSRWRPSFRFYSIVGMPLNDPVDEPWQPDQLLQSDRCSSASAPGLTYQQLSIETGGLRWPVCQNDDFSAMFQEIAKGVVDISQLACAWSLPDPPPGKIFDSEKITVTFTQDDGDTVDLDQVDDEDDCGKGWRLDNPEDPHAVLLCEDSCRDIREHEHGKINIGVPCDSIIDPPM